MQIHKQVGHAGLVGWREKVAELVAPPAAKHGPVNEDQVRALVGGAFFVLSVYYVVSTVVRALKSANR
jgi:hypothetical protein